MIVGFLLGAGVAGVTGFVVRILVERDRRSARVIVLLRGPHA